MTPVLLAVSQPCLDPRDAFTEHLYRALASSGQRKIKLQIICIKIKLNFVFDLTKIEHI